MIYPKLLLVDDSRLAAKLQSQYDPRTEMIVKSPGSAMMGYRVSEIIDEVSDERKATFGRERYAQWMSESVQLRLVRPLNGA